MLQQRTLEKEIKVTGIGLHSGKKVTLRLIPAPINTGIQFRRSDLTGSEMIPAHALSVGATENNTTLGHGPGAIHTVEHLLAALYGLGINNLYCEVDGPEVPIMDGSSSSFVFILKEAGIELLNASKKFIVMTKKVRVEHNGAWAEIEPADRLTIDSTIVFAHPIINKQRLTFEFSCENFIKEISRARTFGLLVDVDNLKRKGLVRGGSLDNAIVLDDFKVVNNEGLRFQNEFVRHKILDTLGDLSLLGHEIAAKVTTFKSGHWLHNQLCRKVLADPDCYQVVSANNLKQVDLEPFKLPQLITATHS